MKFLNTAIMNKNLLVVLVLFLLTALPVFSQKVDTVEYEGKQYFVYPFKKEIKSHSFYKHTLKISKQYSREMEAYYKRILAGDETVTVDEIRAMGDRDTWLDSYGSKPDYYSRKLVKAARANPYPLLIQRFSLEEDIIPSLDPIPDGEYLQLYEDVCLTDENGECQNIPFFVAGKFSIKDNALDGEAMWFNLQGDTLKHGFFKNGLREGEWKLETHEMEYSLYDEDVELYIDRGYPKIDTTISYYTFKNGAKNGPYRKYYMSKYPTVEGNYTDGEASGYWAQRDIRYYYEGSDFRNRIRSRNNDKVTYQYTRAADTIVVHHPWIRTGLIRNNNSSGDFNFYPELSIVTPPSDLFSIAFDREEQLEMEEETWDSHDLYGRDDYYQDYGIRGGRYGNGSNLEFVSDPITKRFMSRGFAIDSVGMIANYSGVLEATYSNGQRMYRYEFEDGHLVNEDTIFWDNGNAHDVIEYVADSNHYLRSIYDYDGKLFRSLVYDSLGDFDHYQYYFDGQEYAYIEGYKVPINKYQDYYHYNNWDTIGMEPLKDVIVLGKSWYELDTSLIYSSTFNPNTRTLIEEAYGADGTLAEYKELTFSEDYESWTGFTDRFFGPYHVKLVRSGTRDESSYFDTIPARNMRYYHSRYEVATDYTLFKDGVPYTGDVNINFEAKKTRLLKKGVNWDIDANQSYKKRNKIAHARHKAVSKNRSKGKPMHLPELSYLDAGRVETNFGETFYEDFIPRNVRDVLGQYSSMFVYSENSDNMDGSIEGYMLDGKPHGNWKLYNSNKKPELDIEAEFVNGEIQGAYHEYESQGSYEYYRNPKMKDLMRDSLPDKLVRYKAIDAEYKNDKLHGAYTKYNWLGEVIESSNYEEGYLDGRSIERNNLITTYSNYKNGLEDGYYQTYITLPGRDSILLYDLNFQDGALQGKSEAYHINGQLAKRGFFLNGESIDDYEAFDSLGFRYHYVKFEYSYPVEEKLWEENQLSVRYLFDWQDSIDFVPRDITQSESLERLVAKMGLIDDYLTLPYYGRSTLVDKDNIKYHMTKYYPNDTIARDGDLDDGKKVGHWKFYDYYGELLYEVDYFDTIFSLNDSIRFKSRGILTDFSPEGDTLYKAHIIEKFEKYDCSHTDHYEIRQLYTIWEADDSLGRMNGYVRNFYDNGVLQSEGQLKDGLPTGPWKLYDPFGKLNQYGYYVQGKRNGRWLSGDLSKTKYLGDICLNPNLPDLKREIRYRENLLDITITNFKLGKVLNKQFYDLDMNEFRDVDNEEPEED